MVVVVVVVIGSSCKGGVMRPRTLILTLYGTDITIASTLRDWSFWPW